MRVQLFLGLMVNTIRALLRRVFVLRIPLYPTCFSELGSCIRTPPEDIGSPGGRMGVGSKIGRLGASEPRNPKFTTPKFGKKKFGHVLIYPQKFIPKGL